MTSPKQIEITVSVSGKIPRQSYENYAPMFSVKEIHEVISDEERYARQVYLQGECEKLFNTCRDKIQLEELQSQYKNFDFILNPADGRKYPRVTDILYWDVDFYTNPEVLSQYGARGSAIHELIEHYISSQTAHQSSGTSRPGGDWGPFEKVISKRNAIILKTGSEKLWDSLDLFDFPGFCAKYGESINWMDGEFRGFNREHFYTGQPDRIGEYEGKKCIFEFKTRGIKELDLCQMAAYSKLEDPRLEGIERLVAIPLNSANKQGFGKPVVVEKADIEKYWNLFLRHRRDFKEKFSI